MSDSTPNFHETSGAVFSPCGRYRYRLWRRWNSGPVLTCVLLNPSTADEHRVDPTVLRCQRRAEQMGFGGVMVVNLFAWRARDPRELYRVADPVGPDNDWSIVSAAEHADLVLCGWGNHGRLRDRSQRILRLLAGAGITPHVLRMTDAGEPAHPLHLGYAVPPRPMALGWPTAARGPGHPPARAESTAFHRSA